MLDQCPNCLSKINSNSDSCFNCKWKIFYIPKIELKDIMQLKHFFTDFPKRPIFWKANPINEHIVVYFPPIYTKELDFLEEKKKNIILKFLKSPELIIKNEYQMLYRNFYNKDLATLKNKSNETEEHFKTRKKIIQFFKDTNFIKKINK